MARSLAVVVVSRRGIIGMMLIGGSAVVIRTVPMGRRGRLMVAERHAKSGADPGHPL